MTGFAVAYGILAIIMGIANIAFYMEKYANLKIPNEVDETAVFCYDFVSRK